MARTKKIATPEVAEEIVETTVKVVKPTVPAPISKFDPSIPESKQRDLR